MPKLLLNFIDLSKQSKLTIGSQVWGSFRTHSFVPFLVYVFVPEHSSTTEDSMSFFWRAPGAQRMCPRTHAVPSTRERPIHTAEWMAALTGHLFLAEHWRQRSSGMASCIHSPLACGIFPLSPLCRVTRPSDIGKAGPQQRAVCKWLWVST